MLIFISIFIPASLRGSVEIWTRNEIEGNRSPVENRSKNLVWTSGRKSGISSFVRKSREKGRERICLFIFFSNLEKWKINREQNSRIPNTSLRYIIILTFLLKCEVFREMTALVIASEEEQCGWMAQLKCPQVQYALEQTTEKRNISFWIVKRISLRKKKKRN